ncbi:ADP-ribosylation factor-related protein 1 isoform X4 [Lagenorhynchus albirostris]|uniref:ADP-ribosylation factor-related protein 1 isoform X4 n=1 Tax=Lagenorhynchus albirostris TaxID=27610 RepID=UPI0028EF82D1|nr:ADP-ribosylation factor-related protein 1 isoform X4 [Lagenorhynchus albirostris]
MYTLLSGLYKYMFQKDEYCILILGLDNAGKTTFLEQSKTRFNKNYKGMSLSKITTTVGLNRSTPEGSSSWGLPQGGQVPAAQHPVLLPPSTTRSATASSTSSTPRMRSGCPSPSEHSRRWSQARRWTVSPSWCWPTSRTLRLASPSPTSRLCSATAPPRSAGATA